MHDFPVRRLFRVSISRRIQDFTDGEPETIFGQFFYENCMKTIFTHGASLWLWIHRRLHYVMLNHIFIHAVFEGKWPVIGCLTDLSDLIIVKIPMARLTESSSGISFVS